LQALGQTTQVLYFWEVWQRMLLTKKYYRQRQYIVVGFCTLAAIIVGSVQTKIIIDKCSPKARRASHAKKQKEA
jgi:hypothetical protein